MTATFNDSATSYPVTISKYGEGNGTVTTQPGGLMCGPTCTASYPLGSLITLKAQSDAGSVFVGFTACPSIGDCVITPKGAVTVGARFELTTTNYALTVSKSGDGTGTVTSSPARIDCGATCTGELHRGHASNAQRITIGEFDFRSLDGRRWQLHYTNDVCGADAAERLDGPGACINVGAGTSCTVTMSSDYTVGVRKLVTSTYTQAIILAGTGAGSVSSTAVPTLVCPATNCAYSAYSWIGGVLSATANPGGEIHKCSSGAAIGGASAPAAKRRRNSACRESRVVSRI